MDKNKYRMIPFGQIPEPEKMDSDSLFILNEMITYASELMDWQVHINSSYRDGDDGQHGKGKAWDLYFYKDTPGDVGVLEQFIFALQYDWKGIGYYPYWNTPGIHVDNRISPERRRIWKREKNGNYVTGWHEPSITI